MYEYIKDSELIRIRVPNLAVKTSKTKTKAKGTKRRAWDK